MRKESKILIFLCILMTVLIVGMVSLLLLMKDPPNEDNYDSEIKGDSDLLDNTDDNTESDNTEDGADQDKDSSSSPENSGGDPENETDTDINDDNNKEESEGSDSDNTDPDVGEDNESEDIPENNGNSDTEKNEDGTESDKESDTTVSGGENSEVEAFTVKYISGTENAYTIQNNTLTFNKIDRDSVYLVSGTFNGNIVFDVGNGYKFELEMHGFTLVSDSNVPVLIKSGDEVTLCAKKGYENFIYDKRTAIDTTDGESVADAVYALCDLEISGKGKLSVISDNNNGIHTKDDLQIKNLTLYVKCKDNALKGNDSITVEYAETTLIASIGDCLKTSNSSISSSGKQKGIISIIGGRHELYAACDAIDAAYDVVIDGIAPYIDIYTDKNSEYSEEVTAVSENVYYIRFSTDIYKYSVKYYNSDDDILWVDAKYHTKVSGGRTTYYYYSFPKNSNYSQMQIYIYSSESESSQDEDYLGYTDYLSHNEAYDTVAFSARYNSITYLWTNYTTNVNNGMGGGFGGPGGMGDGNSDKGNHSTKGIKASNSIIINTGTLNISSYDDAIHASGGALLENGEIGSGNITINAGNITVSSADDGIHADGTLTVNGGMIDIKKSYEGIEGSLVVINDGSVSVISSDDGINATSTIGAAVSVNGGDLYVYAKGDGIDSNSRTSYGAILFAGGNTVVISASNGNSAIDSDGGYRYTGGHVLALMPTGGMSGEATHCSNFSDIATKKSISISSGDTLSVVVDANTVFSVKSPVSMTAAAIFLGSNTANISAS